MAGAKTRCCVLTPIMPNSLGPLTVRVCPLASSQAHRMDPNTNNEHANDNAPARTSDKRKAGGKEATPKKAKGEGPRAGTQLMGTRTSTNGKTVPCFAGSTRIKRMSKEARVARIKAQEAKCKKLKEDDKTDSDPELLKEVTKGALLLDGHEDGKKNDGNVSNYPRALMQVLLEETFTREQIERCADKDSDERAQRNEAGTSSPHVFAAAAQSPMVVRFSQSMEQPSALRSCQKFYETTATVLTKGAKRRQIQTR